MNTISDHFREEIEAFLRRHDMLPTHFGEQALNNPSFIPRLRSGMSCRAATMDRVLAWMRQYDAADPLETGDAA